jgi:hypothetical protein
MDHREQKMALERFLTAHEIEMLPTARLCQYGRRFSAYFPEIACRVNPEQKSWGRRIVADLAAYVATLNPADFQKSPDARPVHVAKKYRKMNKTRQFLFSWEWRALRYEVLKERGARCELCGATANDSRIEVDHIKPLSKSWHLRLDKANLQILCRDCNRGKGNQHFDDFRARTSRKIET